MKDNLTKYFDLNDIIFARINFIKNNNIFDKEEYKYYNIGELNAYEEILNDIEEFCISDFIKKYIEIIKKNSIDIGKESSIGNSDKKERMVGYNNAIIFILSLLNPMFEYEL